jgi:hypothetical protein
MTGMDDLVTWLRAQLDEDERDMNARPAEVDAKRRILDLHTPARPGDPSYGCPTCWEGAEDGGPMDYPCPTLRLLALPYADRPGYQGSWRP